MGNGWGEEGKGKEKRGGEGRDTPDFYLDFYLEAYRPSGVSFKAPTVK